MSVTRFFLVFLRQQPETTFEQCAFDFRIPRRHDVDGNFFISQGTCSHIYTLTNNKWPLVFLSSGEQRFRRLISSFECEIFEESWVSKASSRKWAWVLVVFDQRRVERDEAVLKENYSGEPLMNDSPNEIAEEHLDFILARFISEARRKRLGSRVSREDFIRNNR